MPKMTYKKTDMNQIVTPSLGFSEAINQSTSRIFQIHGRARRSEYWWTMVLVLLSNIVLTPFIGFFVDLATIPLTFRRLHDIGRSGWWWGAGIILKLLFVISLIYDLIMMGINKENINGYEDKIAFALITKYSIWLFLIFIYKIIMLIFMCQDSEQFENRYGPSSKYIDNDTTEV